MKRIGILTAGGDTPPSTLPSPGPFSRRTISRSRYRDHQGVQRFAQPPCTPRSSQSAVYQEIPELDPTHGGSILGASRDYVDAEDTETIGRVAERLLRLKIEGLICVGGDGTLNGMQPLSQTSPSVLAPKTIDNDLGLNYLNERQEWIREPVDENAKGYHYPRAPPASFELDEIVNYATPGYATAVYVSSLGVERIRTTAESHRRVAIIEVMGRDSGSSPWDRLRPARHDSYPSRRSSRSPLVERVQAILDMQKHVVICVPKGIVGRGWPDPRSQRLEQRSRGEYPVRRRGGGGEAYPRRKTRRCLLHTQATKREGGRRDLRPEDRSYATRWKADPV